MAEMRLMPGETLSGKKIKIVVAAARYQGKWIMCRHRDRDTWELPGGRVENGEAPEAAARRELFEETGATEMQLHFICPYIITRYGAVYFAEVKTLSEIPAGSEIAEICLTDGLPEELTYPDAHRQMFHQVQCWLNLQSKADEIWDVLDAGRHRTGRVHRRGDPLPAGDYHLVVDIWIRNSEGEFLITKRSPNKGYPNMWEMTGGSAVAGDNSLSAALREVREETGIDLPEGSGRLIWQYSRTDSHKDVWLFEYDFDLDKVVLQEGETCGKGKASREEIEALMLDGRFVPVRYWQEEAFQQAIGANAQ